MFIFSKMAYGTTTRRVDFPPCAPYCLTCHQEFDDAHIEHRRGETYADENHSPNLLHGSGVTAKVVGRLLGTAKKATAVILDKMLFATARYHETVVYEKVLESLLIAADNIARKGRAGKSVVNISMGGKRGLEVQPFWDTMRKSYLLVPLRIGGGRPVPER